MAVDTTFHDPFGDPFDTVGYTAYRGYEDKREYKAAGGHF